MGGCEFGDWTGNALVMATGSSLAGDDRGHTQATAATIAAPPAMLPTTASRRRLAAGKLSTMCGLTDPCEGREE